MLYNEWLTLIYMPPSWHSFLLKAYIIQPYIDLADLSCRINFQVYFYKEYLKLLTNIRYNLAWVSLRLINREAVYEKGMLTQTRLYKYNLFNNFKYSL
jgi:hypothetical protein